MKQTMAKKAPEPYKLSDQVITRLNRQMVRRAAEVKRNLSQLGFDELNVMKQIDGLYSWLDKNNRKQFEQLFYYRYIEMIRYLSDKPAMMDDDEIDDLVEMHIAGLLKRPNGTVHYTYDTEVLRKRDRAKEAINSVPTNVQKQIEIEKALRFWAQMTAWFADFTSQDAEIQAYKDCNVEYVQRHEQNDDKVCPECRQADGEIYEIGKIPDLPHPRCRRWFTKSDKTGKKNIDKSSDDGIINKEELFHKHNDVRSKFKFISDERFEQLTIPAKKKGAIILRGSDAVEKHLEKSNATASTLGNVLMFKKDVCTFEVLEETRHFEQNLEKLNDDKPSELRMILNEIDAREYIFENASKFQVPRNELDYLHEQYKALKEQLKQYYEKER